MLNVIGQKLHKSFSNSMTIISTAYIPDTMNKRVSPDQLKSQRLVFLVEVNLVFLALRFGQST